MLGKEVGSVSQRPLKARADVLAKAAMANGVLRLVPSSEGIAVRPELHIDITGWPDRPEARRMLAIEIAQYAILHLPPEQ